MDTGHGRDDIVKCSGRPGVNWLDSIEGLNLTSHQYSTVGRQSKSSATLASSTKYNQFSANPLSSSHNDVISGLSEVVSEL